MPYDEYNHNDPAYVAYGFNHLRRNSNSNNNLYD